MTVPVHHPSAATLLGHAAKALDPAATAAVNQHLKFCRECSETVFLARKAAAILVADNPPAPLSEGSFEKTLELIQRSAKLNKIRPVENTIDLSNLRIVAPVILSKILINEKHSKLFILKMRPGARIAMHGHSGLELTLVLSGEFSDQRGSYGVGDISEADEDIKHAPRASKDGCVCLISVEKPTRYQSWLQRIRPKLTGF